MITFVVCPQQTDLIRLVVLLFATNKMSISIFKRDFRHPNPAYLLVMEPVAFLRASTYLVVTLRWMTPIASHLQAIDGYLVSSTPDPFLDHLLHPFLAMSVLEESLDWAGDTTELAIMALPRFVLFWVIVVKSFAMTTDAYWDHVVYLCRLVAL